jgi:hypothetical protein
VNELTKRELQILLDLAETGEQECPWAWRLDIPIEPPYDSEEAEAVLHKFRKFVGRVR